MNGFERGDRIRRPRLVAAACGAGRGARRERVADIEQYLEQELLALVRGVEVRHAGLVAGGLRTIVGLAVDRFEVLQDAVTGSRHAEENTAPAAPREDYGASVTARANWSVPAPPVLVRDAANEAESVCLTHPSYVSGRSTSPLGTFGTKYVDLGGMTSPASATANTSSTLVGLRRTAAAALPVRTASNAARGSGV